MTEAVVTKTAPLLLLTTPGQSTAEVPDLIKTVNVTGQPVHVLPVDLQGPARQFKVQDRSITAVVSTTENAAWIRVETVPQQPFAIALRENGGSTGYIWRLAGVIGAMPVDEKYIPPKSHLIGPMGVRQFTFTPEWPGDMIAQLQLIRGYEQPIYCIDVSVLAALPANQ